MTDKATITPRMMTEEEVKTYLHRCGDYLAKAKQEAEKDGYPFPERIPYIKLFDRLAIDAWIDTITGKSVSMAKMQQEISARAWQQ